jgi:hypothetical protein
MKRPKTGGRKKGQPNKATKKFREMLATNGVDFEQELAKAIITKDVELIKALQTILPYLQPKLKEQEQPAQPTQPANPPQAAAFPTAKLLTLVTDEQSKA